MKRIVSLVLALCMMIGLTACGGGTEPAGEVSETPLNTQTAQTVTINDVDYSNIEDNATPERVDNIFDEGNGRVYNMYLDNDGTVRWLYDNMNNPRMTQQVADFMSENNSLDGLVDYVLSLGISPNPYVANKEATDSDHGEYGPSNDIDALIQSVSDEYYALNADRATRDEVTMKYNEFTDEYVFSERTVYAEAEQFASWPAGNMIPTGGTYYVNWYEPTAVPDNATSAEIFKFPNVDSYDAYVDDGILKVIIYPVERYHVYYKADRLDGYLVYDNSYIFYYEPAEDIMYAYLDTNYRSSDFVYIGSTDMSEEEICANFEVPQEFLDKLEVQAQEATADQAIVDEYWSQYIYPTEDLDTIIPQIIDEARDIYNEVFWFPFCVGGTYEDSGDVYIYANNLDEMVDYFEYGETFDTRANGAIDNIRTRIESKDYFDYNAVLYHTVKYLYDYTFINCVYAGFEDDSFIDTLNDKLVEIRKRMTSTTKIDSDVANTIYMM